MQKTDPKKLFKDAFKEFILYCRVKNLRSRTTDYYEETYQYFIEFFGKEKYCSDITQKTISDYILYMQTKTNASDITKNTRLRGIRAILYYMMELDYLDKFTIHLIKADKPLKEIYTNSELKLLLKKPDLKNCSFSDYRDWVIVNTLLSTGIRAGTLVELKINDLDFESGVMYLHHMKARKQVTIPMGSILREILVEYLRYRQATKDDDYLFIGVYGAKLITNALGNAIRKYNHRRGVMRTGLHLFRHSFAKMFLENGGNVFQLQSLLAHSRLETTRGYVDLFTSDLQVNYDELNPLKDFAKVKKAHISMKKRGK